MEGINTLGSLTLLGDSGVLKPEKAYRLLEGENTIGRGVACNIRLKNKNPSLLDIHCVLRVSKNGVAISINKSEQIPIRINDKLAYKSQILKHGDTVLIVDKKFRYLNEHLKDKPEDFFTKEKLRLIPVRKSVNPLSKTPGTSSYKSQARSTPHRNLNLSLRAVPTNPTSIPKSKLNQTLNKIATRNNFLSKTPNHYRNLTASKVRKTLVPKNVTSQIPDLGKDTEEDLIAFSPIAQPLKNSPIISIVHEEEVDNLNSSQEPQYNQTNNQSLALNLNESESRNNTARQSKLQESVNSDVGDKDINQTVSDIFEESYKELDQTGEEKRKYITVRPRRLVQEAKTSDDSDLEENLQSSSTSRSSPHHKDDCSRTSTRTKSVEEFEAFFLKNMDSSVIESDTSFMAQEEKSMSTNRELPEVSFSHNNVGDVVIPNDEKSMTTNRELSEVSLIEDNEDDDIMIPETQQANDDSVFLGENDAIEGVGEAPRTGTISSDSFNSVYLSTTMQSQRLTKSPVEKPRRDTVSSVGCDTPKIQCRRPIKSLTNARSPIIYVPSSSEDESFQEDLNLPEGSKKNSSTYVSAITIGESTSDAVNTSSELRDTESTQNIGNIAELKETTLNKSLKPITTNDATRVVNISASESRDTIQNKSSKRISTFDESTEVVNKSASESRDTIQNKSSKRVSTFDESTQDAVNISVSETRDTIQNKSSKRVSTFDEPTEDALNILASFNESTQDAANKSASESRDAIQNKSSTRVSTVNELTEDAVNISVSESRDTIQDKSSKRVSTFDESTQDDVNKSASEAMDKIQNKSSKEVSTFNKSTQDESASESRDTIPNKSSKRVSTFAEPTQDAVNISASESRGTTQNKSSKGVNTFDESTQDAANESASESRDTIPNKSSKRVSTFDESTQDSVNISTSRDAIPNKSSKRVSTFDESTQDAVNISTSRDAIPNKSSKRVSTFDESTQDAINTSLAGPTTRNKSSNRISTFDESTQDAVNISSSESKPKRMSTFDESTQEAVNISASESKQKRMSTFDESTQDAVNISVSEPKPKRMSTFDESTQDAINISASESKPKRMSTFDESTQDAVNISVSESKPKRMSTFDESTQVVDKTKIETQDGKSTKTVSQYVSDKNAINILDDTEFLSPVRPLRKSIRAQASVVNVSNNTALHGSTMSQTLTRQLSDSSMTDTSLNPSSASAKSVSSHSFSSFKHNKPDTSKAGKLEETEMIDVVNITDAGLVQNPDVADAIDETSASISKSRVSLSERRLSNRTSQMFVDVTCTSTPFQKQYTTRLSNKKKRSSSLCSNNTLRASAVTERRRSSRISVSKNDEHDCFTCGSGRNRSKSLDTSKNCVIEPKTPLVTFKDLTVSIAPLESHKNVSATSKRSLSHFKNVEDSNTSLFKTPVSHKNSGIREKAAITDDETPKSHLTPSRRSSKSTYNPKVEDITPVTPERLCVSGFSDDINIPSNTTPVMFDRVNVERQSTKSITEDVEKAKLDSTSKNISIPQREMRQQRSPLNRLSNFEGVKKLMKTPPNSPKNDLRNIPNLRRMMSPKQQKSPLNDLTNPVGVKNLLKTPKQQKNPIDDLSNVSGVAQIFNVSGIEVLRQRNDIENCEDLFTRLTGHPPRRSYRKCNSLSMSKAEMDLNFSETMPDSSPSVQEWVEKTGAVKGEPFNDDYDVLADDDVLADEPTQKSRSEQILSAKKDTLQTDKSNKYDVRYANVLKNEESDESTDEDEANFNASASLNSEALKSEYNTEFDDSTDAEVSLQNESLNLEKSDDKQSNLQESDESSLEYSDDKLDAQNSDDQLSLQDSDHGFSLENSGELKLEDSDRSNFFSSSEDEDVFVNEISEKRARHSKDNRSKKNENDDDANLFDNMSKRPVRKSKSGRSLSPKKRTPQQMKGRKSVFNFSATTAVPDVEIWKQERNEQTDTPSKRPKRKSGSVAEEVENDYDSTLFDNISKGPVRKSKSGRSLTPKKWTPQQMKGRKSVFNFPATTAVPDVEIWKQERNEQTNINKADTPSKRTKRKRGSVAEEVENDYDSTLFDNMSKGPVRKSKSGRSLSPKKRTPQQMKGRKSVFNFSAATAVPDVETWKRERNEEIDREQLKNLLKGTKRKSSLITQEVLPEKKRCRVAFNLPDEESSPEVAKKRKTTRSGRVIKETSKKVYVKEPKREKGKAAQAAKEVSDKIDNENNRAEDNPEEGESASGQTGSKTKTRSREKNTINIDDNLAEVNPVKKRGRKENSVEATKSIKVEVKMQDELESVVDIPPPKRRRQNTRKMTVVKYEESEIEGSPPKPRTRRAKSATQTTTDADSVSTSPKPTGGGKNVAEAKAVTDSASASSPKTKGLKAKNAGESTAVTDSASASTPIITRGRRAKNMPEATAVIDSASVSTPIKGRKAKNVAEATAVTDIASTSTPITKGRKAKNTEATAVTDIASASSPITKGRKAKNTEATSVTDSASTSITRGRRAKNVASASSPEPRGRKDKGGKLSDIKGTSSATVIATSTTRANNQTKNVKETIDSPPKKRGRKAEAKVVDKQEKIITVSPPKTRKRNAKLAIETPQPEESENKQTTTKPRGRRAKNVAEETAEVERSTSSTSKPNQEEMDNERALPKTRGRKAKNVTEEAADFESPISSTPKLNQEEIDNRQSPPKLRGRRGRNVAEESGNVESSTSSTSKPNLEEMVNKQAAPKPRGRRAKNVETAESSTSSMSKPEEMDNKQAAPKPRGRGAKNLAGETAEVKTSTSSTSKSNQEEMGNKQSPPKPRGRRAKNVETADFESSTSSTSKPKQEDMDKKQAPPKPRGRRAKNVVEETADVEISTSSTPKKRGRKAKTESIDDVEPVSTSAPNKTGRSTRAACIAQENNNEETAAPPKKRTRR